MSEVKPVTILPPCSAACPAGTDVRGYVQAIGQGKYEEAFEIARARNPFVSVCGRICPHPCEEQCRRGSIDAAISSRALKRFITEKSREYRRKNRPQAQLTKTSKIAVIGSGPSGLTAAADLARSGYPVTVFEKEPRPGGMLVNAIPKYRLPEDILQEDIDDILSLGVEIVCNQTLGRDLSINELHSRGYQAILLSLGLQLSNSLPIPGIEAEGCHLALPLLNSIARGEKTAIGEKVVVVGGGNVAIDVARSVRRTGSVRVTVICLENSAEMPASPWEVTESVEEGIDIIHSMGPSRILAGNGKVQAVEFKACKRVFDENGRFAPLFCEEDLSLLECDSVVLAIGQRNDLSFSAREGLATTGTRLVYSPESLNTSIPGVFVTGELATGPGAAIQAIASGHNAAGIIRNYLETGQFPEAEDKSSYVIGPVPESTRRRVMPEKGILLKNLPPEKRISGFEPYEAVLSEEEAIYESRRCLNCGSGAELIPGKCAGCLSCQRTCPFEVPRVTSKAHFALEGCVACGICAAECPACAVSILRFPEHVLNGSIRNALSAGSQVIFECARTCKSRSEMEKTKTVMLPCLAALAGSYILKAFEMGAETVEIKTCPGKECTLAASLPRLSLRVRKIIEDLKELGLEDKISYAG